MRMISNEVKRNQAIKPIMRIKVQMIDKGKKENYKCISLKRHSGYKPARARNPKNLNSDNYLSVRKPFEKYSNCI